MASAFMEYSSFLRLLKIYKEKVQRFTARFSQIRWSQARCVVLATAIFCTVSSLLLTLILWGAVHKSLGNAARDTSVLVFLTIAAFLRLIRQFMEGLTLIIGIASREYKWLNSSSKHSFGCIAFSSFVLLIHSSSITYNFSNQGQKVWGAKQCAIVAGLFFDVLFRLFVCGWATFNSSCFTKAMFIGIQCRTKCSILGDYISQYFLRFVVSIPIQICNVICYAYYVVFIRDLIYAQLILLIVKLLSHTLILIWKTFIVSTQLFLLICVTVVQRPNEERQIDLEGLDQDTFIVEMQQEINMDHTREYLVYTPTILIIRPNIVPDRELFIIHRHNISPDHESFMIQSHQEINRDHTRENLIYNHTIFILHPDSLYDQEAFIVQINQEQNSHHTQEYLGCPHKLFILHPARISLYTAPPRNITVRQNLYIRPFLPSHGGDIDPPFVPSMQGHYANPVVIGSPFPLLRLETRCIGR